MTMTAAEGIVWPEPSRQEEPGRPWQMRVRVEAGEPLKEQLLGFVQPRYRKELGQEALFLHSNHHWTEYRRIQGDPLMPDDAHTERRFRRAQMANIKQMRLYRTNEVQEIIQPGGQEFLAIGLIVQLGQLALEQIQQEEVIASELLWRDGMPVHMAWRGKYAIAPRYVSQATRNLQDFLDARPNYGNTLSPNPQAYATNMELRQKPLPPQRQNKMIQ